MRLILLFLLLPLLASAQYDRYGEQLFVQDIAGNTLSLRGQHFGIDSGPDMEFKWEIHKDGELYKVFQRKENDPFLKVTLLLGNYRIVRYTYYYTDGVVTGITESEALDLSFPFKDPVQEREVVPLEPALSTSRISEL